MRELAALTFLTLDGVMQGPMSPDEDRSGGFDAGGWAAPYFADVMPQVMETAMAAPYDLLLGRKTYQAFASHWPSVQNDPVADKLNSARKFIVSNGEVALDWQNSTQVTGHIPTAIAALKDQDGPLLQVHGSAQLLQMLMVNDLVDELRLWHFPVVTGPGKHLFGYGLEPRRFKLIDTATTQSGVVHSVYRRAPAQDDPAAG
ncbi:MAG: dihydrofolate reductase family protein [Pseudomonadota bacterium]